jgi:hypothetical protein
MFPVQELKLLKILNLICFDTDKRNSIPRDLNGGIVITVPYAEKIVPPMLKNI